MNTDSEQVLQILVLSGNNTIKCEGFILQWK